MHPSVRCSTIYNSQDKKQADRGVHNEDAAHTYDGILLSHQKEQNNAICNNVDGPRDYHTELSQTQRDKQHYHITYVWNLRKRYK